jgi:5-methylcytosine-specific restriction endonuclease McrA
MVKVCTGCLIEKPLELFGWKKARSLHNSRCKSCESEYQRSRYWESPDKYRAKSLRSMKQLRADPKWLEPHLVARRKYWAIKAKKREQAYLAEFRETKPWEWKVKNLKRNISKEITLAWLRARWAAQDGKCALSGRPLDIRTASIDHIIPTSRAGTHDLRNLRLVTPEANSTKHGMTDEELLILCRDILKQHEQIPEMLGRAILAAERE